MSDRSELDDRPNASYRRRNEELFSYLVNTFVKFLDNEKAAEFRRVIAVLEKSVEDNCRSCTLSFDASVQEERARRFRDPRRQRFLLRLVSSRCAHLFAGDRAVFPRSVVEGLDNYLRKSLGDVIYGEINEEAASLLAKITSKDDDEMMEKIRANVEWKRFYDLILIRILLRFEQFPKAQKTFITIIDRTMQDKSQFNFTEIHFPWLFNALFSDIFAQLSIEEQRLRWDYMFGDGTSRKLENIHRASRPKPQEKPGGGGRYL